MTTLLSRLTLLTALPFSVAVAGECAQKITNEEGVVRHVYDGDTLRLHDGRKLRLIGINSPEIKHQQPDQPLAHQARENLQQLLPVGARIQIEFGHRRQDNYGRLLAHVYTHKGINVSAEQLRRGLAFLLVIPPNTGKLRCYRTARNSARRMHLGVWKHPFYEPRLISDITKNNIHPSFVWLRGKVKNVKRTNKSIWLNFGADSSIRIPHYSWRWFREFDFASLEGSWVRASGYFHWYGKRGVLTLRHPDMLAKTSVSWESNN